MGRGGGLRPGSGAGSQPGVVWCYFGSCKPEEAEHLAPEANLRLRPIGEHPLGCRGRGRPSGAGVLWHTWLVPSISLCPSLSLHLPRYCGSARSACFWLILCPHSMFCATGHTVLHSGDQIAVLLHHHTALRHREQGESRPLGGFETVLTVE